MGSSPVGVNKRTSALSDAVQNILAILYSDFHLDTKTCDELIRERYAAGEALSDLDHQYSISPQGIYLFAGGRNSKRVEQCGIMNIFRSCWCPYFW
jgi:hypothetical protein